MNNNATQIRQVTPERARELFESGDQFMIAVPCAPNYPAFIIDVSTTGIKRGQLKVHVQYANGWNEGGGYWISTANLNEEIPIGDAEQQQYSLY